MVVPLRFCKCLWRKWTFHEEYFPQSFAISSSFSRCNWFIHFYLNWQLKWLIFANLAERTKHGPSSSLIFVYFSTFNSQLISLQNRYIQRFWQRKISTAIVSTVPSKKKQHTQTHHFQFINKQSLSPVCFWSDLIRLKCRTNAILMIIYFKCSMCFLGMREIGEIAIAIVNFIRFNIMSDSVVIHYIRLKCDNQHISQNYFICRNKFIRVYFVFVLFYYCDNDCLLIHSELAFNLINEIECTQFGGEYHSYCEIVCVRRIYCEITFW